MHKQTKLKIYFSLKIKKLTVFKVISDKLNRTKGTHDFDAKAINCFMSAITWKTHCILTSFNLVQTVVFY